MTEELIFFNRAALEFRLSRALKNHNQETVFLIGSGVTAPPSSGLPGVATVEGMIDLIRNEFVEDPNQLADFNDVVDSAGKRRYQAAFLFVQGRLGQSVANEIVRKAVLACRLPASNSTGVNPATCGDDTWGVLELDPHWALNPGVVGLSHLLTRYPQRFGRSLLTTNFDPLIEVAMRTVGGPYFRTTLHADGDLSQTEGPGCHICHLHGYWYGSDTLHTPRQLQQSRPRLKASLAATLRNKLVVVVGYGGWDDVFTSALLDVVREDSAAFEILWAFYSENPTLEPPLLEKLSPGISRGRVSLYSGIDCNRFFPELYEIWKSLEPEGPLPKIVASNAVRVSESLRLELERRTPEARIIEGDDEDRPPVIALCVGREAELEQLHSSSATVVFVTGIGGQGKSTVAAQYFAETKAQNRYSYFIWRDCKEESERFETQLASVIELLSNGRISGEDLAKQDAASIVRLFLNYTKDLNGLFVFDNADHYVNLETGRMTASPDILVQALLTAELRSRVILTCRPSVNYYHLRALSFDLQGISLDATRKLFSGRGASFTDAELEQAHRLTNGHAFWLDLLSLQVTKSQSAPLGELLSRITLGSGDLPQNTLNSIWSTLREREQSVLRSMAETVRPATEDEIASYVSVSSKLNFNKVNKALNTLRSLNLIVVKKRPPASDLLELHPLVRQFVRQTFSKIERSVFIEGILKIYTRFIGSNRYALILRPTLTTLQYWTQAVELDIEAGRIAEGFATLLEVADTFAISAYAREFSRVVRPLLSSFDWVSDHGKYKGFDDIFRLHVVTLSYLGENDVIDDLLDRFELTVADRDSRYILYCDMKCFSMWERGQFANAVRWGERGQKLKESSNVDTKFNTSHNLALSQRDAGRPDLALPIFLGQHILSEIIDPDEFDEKPSADFYGNVGRCLHQMGQFDSAIVCYQKSAILIEKDPRQEHFINQGFIRRWIAETLIARNEFTIAGILLEAARLKWEFISPPRAAQVAALQRQYADKFSHRAGLSSHEIERVFRDWIFGRPLDVRWVT